MTKFINCLCLLALTALQLEASPQKAFLSQPVEKLSFLEANLPPNMEFSDAGKICSENLLNEVLIPWLESNIKSSNTENRTAEPILSKRDLSSFKLTYLDVENSQIANLSFVHLDKTYSIEIKLNFSAMEDYYGFDSAYDLANEPKQAREIECGFSPLEILSNNRKPTHLIIRNQNDNIVRSF